MLRWMYNKTRDDKIRNENIQKYLGIEHNRSEEIIQAFGQG